MCRAHSHTLEDASYPGEQWNLAIAFGNILKKFLQRFIASLYEKRALGVILLVLVDLIAKRQSVGRHVLGVGMAQHLVYLL